DYVDINHPFYKFVGHMSGIRWVNKPTGTLEPNNLEVTIELSLLGHVLLLPHTTDYKRDWNGLKFSKYDWVFTHHTFQGTQLAPGVNLRGIPTEQFKGKTRVISGDIHVPQSVTANVM